MAIRKILTYPNLALKKVSSPVKKFDRELKTLVKDLFETMYDAPGVGLAAVQINIHKCLFVIDIDFEQDEENDGVITNKKSSRLY